MVDTNPVLLYEKLAKIIQIIGNIHKTAKMANRTYLKINAIFL